MLILLLCRCVVPFSDKGDQCQNGLRTIMRRAIDFNVISLIIIYLWSKIFIHSKFMVYRAFASNVIKFNEYFIRIVEF